MKRLATIILALVALFAVALPASAQFPSVQLKALDGSPVDADTLSNEGNTIVVRFFSTWCKTSLS